MATTKTFRIKYIIFLCIISFHSSCKVNNNLSPNNPVSSEYELNILTIINFLGNHKMDDSLSTVYVSNKLRYFDPCMPFYLKNEKLADSIDLDYVITIEPFTKLKGNFGRVVFVDDSFSAKKYVFSPISITADKRAIRQVSIHDEWRFVTSSYLFDREIIFSDAWDYHSCGG